MRVGLLQQQLINVKDVTTACGLYGPNVLAGRVAQGRASPGDFECSGFFLGF
jgi:hypothetical protein